jgi:hypothetical protein
MMQPGLGGILEATLDKLIGLERTERLFNVLVVDPVLLEDSGPRASRAKLAQALNCYGWYGEPFAPTISREEATIAMDVREKCIAASCSTQC